MSNLYNVKLYKNNKLDKEYNGINALDNKDLIFFIDSTKNTIGKDFFTRENEEFKFHLDFIKKESTYLLKDKNMLFDIKVDKVEIVNSKNGIDIIYQIETQEEEVKITIEKIN